MQGTTRRRVDQPWLIVLHTLGVLSLLGLALLGQVPAEVAGWLVPPAVPMALGRAKRVRGSPARRGCTHPPGLRAADRAGWRVLGDYLLQSWRPVLLHSLLLWGLGGVERRVGASLGAAVVPWGLWLWRGMDVGWPGLGRWALWQWGERGLWQGQRLLLGYLSLALSPYRVGDQPLLGLGLGCVVAAPSAVGALAEEAVDGWQWLWGEFRQALAPLTPSDALNPVATAQATAQAVLTLLKEVGHADITTYATQVEQLLPTLLAPLTALHQQLAACSRELGGRDGGVARLGLAAPPSPGRDHRTGLPGGAPAARADFLERLGPLSSRI